MGSQTDRADQRVALRRRRHWSWAGDLDVHDPYRDRPHAGQGQRVSSIQSSETRAAGVSLWYPEQQLLPGRGDRGDHRGAAEVAVGQHDHPGSHRGEQVGDQTGPRRPHRQANTASSSVRGAAADQRGRSRSIGAAGGAATSPAAPVNRARFAGPSGTHIWVPSIAQTNRPTLRHPGRRRARGGPRKQVEQRPQRRRTDPPTSLNSNADALGIGNRASRPRPVRRSCRTPHLACSQVGEQPRPRSSRYTVTRAGNPAPATAPSGPARTASTISNGTIRLELTHAPAAEPATSNGHDTTMTYCVSGAPPGTRSRRTPSLSYRSSATSPDTSMPNTWYPARHRRRQPATERPCA